MRTSLISDEAMALWRRGPDAWNAWVEENPEADVDFQVDFQPNETSFDGPVIVFNGYRFPAGRISFCGCRFRNASVRFEQCQFSEGVVDFSSVIAERGPVDFIDCTFGNGLVSFNNAQFQCYYVNFTRTKFGDGGVDFSDAQLGTRGCHFSNVTFGLGDLKFDQAHFGEGHLSFRDIKLKDGTTSFRNTYFGTAGVSFNNVKFGKGDFDFSNCHLRGDSCKFQDVEFGLGKLNFANLRLDRNRFLFEDVILDDGDLSFDNARFGAGSVNFKEVRFGKGAVSFRYAIFDGPAHFVDLVGLECTDCFSFEGAAFKRLFTFSHLGTMGCPLDLRRTKLSHDVVVNDIKCTFDVAPMPRWASIFSQYWSGMPERSAPVWRWSTKAKDREDSQRFCRLKELAVANQNHAKALEFRILEIQSKRKHGSLWWQDLLQFLFWLFGDYGRSVLRPVLCFVIAWVSFASIYWSLRVPFAQTSESTRSIGTAMTYAASNMLSFFPAGRTAKSQGEALLFGASDAENAYVPVSNLVLLVGGAQSIIAVLLLFLIGLGLRNLFRV